MAQAGKPIGLVPHILVNGPTAGHGVFMKNLPDAAE
jgi:hypothetical protein